MSPILITDPNAPPDPNAVRPIPDAQHPIGAPVADPSGMTTRFNPTLPGVPPSPDYPTGITPPDLEAPPDQPPPDQPQTKKKK